MAFGSTLAAALVGVAARCVGVEAEVTAGLPGFAIVGLADTALNEARERVRAALRCTGLDVPDRKVVVNLTPAGLPKSGTSFDVAVAVALLVAAGHLDPEPAGRTVHLGELGLDGRLRPVRGVLAAVRVARDAGWRRVVVPWADADEAALVPDVEVVPAAHLAQVVLAHGGEVGDGVLEAVSLLDRVERSRPTAPARPLLDLADVVGQEQARQALEVAAAGGHHLLLVGPPGAGKTMLASRLPSVLPPLSEEEALEVTAIHSVAGTVDAGDGLVHVPPFEDPHHSASRTAVLGGGSGQLVPGAATRAHRGVLFLDECPEFSRDVLEGLRQPLESGELVIARAAGVLRLPARFQLVLAANPCPCGRASGRASDCRCSSLARRRYEARLSGPLADRIDLRVAVAPSTRAHAARPSDPATGASGSAGLAESSATVAARVAEGRGAAAERLAGTPWRRNADVPGPHLRTSLRLPAPVTADLDAGLAAARLTGRGYDRVLRVAWTLADLAGRTAPDRDDVGRALLWRAEARAAA